MVDVSWSSMRRISNKFGQDTISFFFFFFFHMFLVVNILEWIRKKRLAIFEENCNDAIMTEIKTVNMSIDKLIYSVVCALDILIGGSDFILITVSELTSYQLQWRHNEHDSVSNHRRFDCLLNCLFMYRS